MTTYLMTLSVPVEDAEQMADAVLLFGPLDGHEMRTASDVLFIQTNSFFHNYSRSTRLTANGRRIYVHDQVCRLLG